MATFGTTIGSGGPRFYDADHRVAYNYIQGVYGGNFQSPLLLDTGDAEGSSTNLAGHWRVVGATVERNVIVSCPEGIRIGSNYSLVPRDCTVRDNLVVNVATGAAITQKVAPSNTVLTNNAYFANTTAAGMSIGADTIARKPGYGPRLTYLAEADVGPDGDLSDTDGTGVEVGTVGGVVAVPADVLNIGSGATQNHFSLQYAVNGAATTSTESLAKVAAGFSLDPYFKVVERASDGSTAGTVPHTVGKETDGASSTASSATKITVSTATPAFSGTLTGGHSRVWLSVAGSSRTKLVVYSDSAGAPGTLLATSDEVTVTATAEAVVNYIFSGVNRITLTSGTPIWLGLMWEDPGTPSVTHSRDSTASTRWERSASAAPTWTYPSAPSSFGTPEGPFSGPSDVWLDFETVGTVTSGTKAVQFQVRADSATTSGSSFPRSELRETRADGTNMAFDALFGNHSLRTTTRITHLPTADPEVIVAQLHDGSSDRISVRTQLVSGETKLLVRINGTEAPPRLSEGYVVGVEFIIDIRILDGGLVQVYYNGSTTPLVTGQLVSTGGATWYWKTGAYAQFDGTSAGSSTEYVSVEHRNLAVSHSTPTVSAGADAQVVSGQVFTRAAIEPNLSNVISRRWTIVSSPVPADPGPGTDPPPPTSDLTQAAVRLSWGTPRPESDEFNYTGPPDASKWSLPGSDWAGHDGNGRRRPERQTVDGSKLVMTGLANGDSGWMAHRLDREYGRYEARVRAFNTGTSNGNLYSPVLLIWPTSDSRKSDGEYDYYEPGSPGSSTLTGFMHFPGDGDQQREFTRSGVSPNLGEWHNIGFEWTSAGLTGYLDGVQWFTTSGGAGSGRRNIQAMGQGFATIQLDNFDGTNQTPATFECEWFRLYDL